MSYSWLSEFVVGRCPKSGEFLSLSQLVSWLSLDIPIFHINSFLIMGQTHPWVTPVPSELLFQGRNWSWEPDHIFPLEPERILMFPLRQGLLNLGVTLTLSFPDCQKGEGFPTWKMEHRGLRSTSRYLPCGKSLHALCPVIFSLREACSVPGVSPQREH